MVHYSYLLPLVCAVKTSIDWHETCPFILHVYIIFCSRLVNSLSYRKSHVIRRYIDKIKSIMQLFTKQYLQNVKTIE